MCPSPLVLLFTSVARAYKKTGITTAPKGKQSFFEPLIVFVRDDIAKINGNAEILGSGITAGSRVYEDASYIRLKTISLGYTMPKSIVSKLSLASIRLYVQAYNLYTWTKWSGFDAEWVNLGSGNNGVVPQPRTITGGIKLGF